MDDLSAYAEDVETVSPSDSQLNVISALIKEQDRLEKTVADIEQELKDTKARLMEVSEKSIPDAFADAGIESFTTDDGLSVQLKDDVHASIPAKCRDMAFEWLRKNNHGSLIKRKLMLEYGAGQVEEADSMVEYLFENVTGATLKDQEAVHPATLKSFAKTCLEEGIDIPRDLFGIYQRKVSKLKRK